MHHFSSLRRGYALGVLALVGAGCSTVGPAAVPEAPARLQTPVSEHGALHVVNGRVVDAAHKPLQLRGMSLFWSQWSSFYADSAVDQLVDDWQVGVVRAALGIEEGGYLEHPSDNEAKVVAVVERAIERGVYVIIDWHDHRASEHQASAVEFFTRMARRYGSSPQVIFEIWNEPLDVEWSVVKAYAQAVIAAIRGAGANNLVLVGTPNWSQDIDDALADPLSAVTDVAYVLHFYAGTHGQWLRDRAQRAIDAGLPLFVTEWGTCEATGNGDVSEPETKLWMELLARHQISWANWALNDKDESCSALKPGTSSSAAWVEPSMTRSGALVKRLIR